MCALVATVQGIFEYTFSPVLELFWDFYGFVFARSREVERSSITSPLERLSWQGGFEVSPWPVEV